MSESPFYNVHQLATRLSVSRATVWRWTADGSFPSPIKLGPNTTRWRGEDVEAWMANRATA